MKGSWKNIATVVALILCCLAFLTFTFCSYRQVAQLAAASMAPQKTVVLDAGHGGEDGGATGKSAQPEKDLNLAIAKLVEQKLTEAGYQVVMTREEDASLGDEKLSTVKERKTSDMHRRLAILEGTPGAVFVSIHQNHFTESRYSGAQVFYSKNDSQSKLLAESVRQKIVAEVQPENTRELKPATSSIYLLWHAKTPAILVECGFLSNDSEAKLLNEAAYQEKLAAAIFAGITDYLDQGIGEAASSAVEETSKP